jgi:hypothetical protein
MRNLTRFTLALVATFLYASTAAAGTLPRTIGYSLYVDGVRVGHSGMTVTPGKDVLRFDSQTRVALGPNVIELTSHTEADPATFQVRHFWFEGTKGGMPVAGDVVVKGDSATGWVQKTSSTERRPKVQQFEGELVVFEDWVMDLEVLLALRQAVSATERTTYALLFANSFLPASVLVGFTGDVIVESAERSLVARKLEIAFSGGDPFESQVDPATGVPVYILFPGTRAEAFRDDFFGENPPSRYAGSGSGASTR